MTNNKQMSSAQVELNKAIDGLCADFGKAAGMSAASYRSLLQDNVFALSYREKDRSGTWVTKTQPIEAGGLLRLLQMAKRFNLDPLNREIYPYFNQDGSVTPTLTVDGWLRLVNANPDFDGCRITESEEEILIPGTSKPCAKWCQVELFRKSLRYPIVIRVILRRGIPRDCQTFEQHQRQPKPQRGGGVRLHALGHVPEADAPTQSLYTGGSIRLPVFRDCRCRSRR